MDFSTLLKMALDRGASDIFITAGLAPSIKVHGKVESVSETVLSPAQAREVVLSIMTEKQRNELEQSRECNFGFSAPGIARFRVSAFYQRNHVGMVLRRIETRIPSTEELNLPPILKELVMIKRGLVLMVGGTGSGKSTSLAAMIGHRNQNSSGHIISLEDPIEFVHQHAGCVITQREVGIDTESYEIGLKNTLRQAPDVILIGEVRTRETMDYAIAFAETGHLCLATLHANNANQALDRIINFFPEDRRGQLLMDLSLNLRAVVAQQLIPTLDGKGRRVAVEILTNTPFVADLIHKGAVHELKDQMKRSTEQGMQTFDQALFDLYKQGEISYDDAIHHADSANNVRLMIKLDSGDTESLGESLEEMGLMDG